MLGMLGMLDIVVQGQVQHMYDEQLINYEDFILKN
jgi:hypothetical protein